MQGPIERPTQRSASIAPRGRAQLTADFDHHVIDAALSQISQRQHAHGLEPSDDGWSDARTPKQ